MKKNLKFFLCLIGIVLIGFSIYKIGFFVGQKNALYKTPPPNVLNPQQENLSQSVDFSIFWEAWRRLEENFLEKEKINPQKMVYGAIKGMVESLGDPYTTFFTPQQTKNFSEEMSGEYQGVGMVVGIKNNQLTVISPFKNTPAEKAGLRPGDKIVKINEIFTQNLSIEEAVNLIKGPKGTTVTLWIQRNNWPEAKPIKVKRALIKIPTIEWEKIEPDIALIKIYQFNEILPSQFKKIAQQILNSNVKKIILDLRNNPGGYLEVAQEIAGWFLKKGEIVAIQDSGDLKKEKIYRSKGPSIFSSYPMVILINKGTASGAEILAGALRDNRNIKLVGENSFGKGSVQKQVFLSDGSSLKITVAHWLTPKRVLISKKGLVPDFKIEMKEKDWQKQRDPQLEKAIEIIKKLK